MGSVSEVLRRALRGKRAFYRKKGPLSLDKGPAGLSIYKGLVHLQDIAADDMALDSQLLLKTKDVNSASVASSVGILPGTLLDKTQ